MSKLCTPTTCTFLDNHPPQCILNWYRYSQWLNENVRCVRCSKLPLLKSLKFLENFTHIHTIISIILLLLLFYYYYFIIIIIILLLLLLLFYYYYYYYYYFIIIIIILLLLLFYYYFIIIIIIIILLLFFVSLLSNAIKKNVGAKN